MHHPPAAPEALVRPRRLARSIGANPLGESGTYPAALAAAAEWFPKRERALAIGIFNAGANVGAGTTTVMIDRSASVNNATGIRVRTSIQFPGGAATARIGD